MKNSARGKKVARAKRDVGADGRSEREPALCWAGILLPAPHGALFGIKPGRKEAKPSPLGLRSLPRDGTGQKLPLHGRNPPARVTLPGPSSPGLRMETAHDTDIRGAEGEKDA